ncbi:lytic transglycosylase domain-containing protein [Desulfoprunum benzoelyticum]|nr:lytic transglycosylase domain-containing protein [Desulfoprunum benzoelyticum]
MFVCDDGRGRMHFTNTPTGQNCKPFTPRQKYIESPRNTYRVYKGTYRGTISPSTYDQYIKRVGSMYNVDPYLIKAVIRTESDFNHRAVSSKGAQGLMQLMPGTAADLRVENPFNPGENIDGGVRYLRSLLDTFDNNLILSLAAYNAGPGLVKRAGGVPRIPETIDYVRKVMSNYRMYKASGG